MHEVAKVLAAHTYGDSTVDAETVPVVCIKWSQYAIFQWLPG